MSVYLSYKCYVTGELYFMHCFHSLMKTYFFCPLQKRKAVAVYAVRDTPADFDGSSLNNNNLGNLDE